MYSNWKKGIFVLIIGFCLKCYSDHPNEGTVTLNSLIKQAELNNLSIKKAELILNSSEFDLLVKKAKFYPEFSVEGGQLFSKRSDEKTSGTFIYGKVDWNIYRGGFDDANIEKANLNFELEKYKFNTLKAKIKREVSKLYYEMLFILESISLKEKALKMNSEQMKLAIVKKNSGFTSNTDVIEFELRDSTLSSDLMLLNQDREQKSKELTLILGESADQSFASIKGHLHRDKMDINKEKLLERLKSRNSTLVENRINLQINQQEQKIIQADFYPKLDFESEFGKLANEEKVLETSSNYAIRLKLTIPLFSGFETINSNKSIQAYIGSMKMDQSIQMNGIEAEMENVLNSIEALNKRLDIEEKNLSRSEEYYKLTLSEYKRGVKNSPDMVGASERLLEARIRNLEFRRDIALLLIKLEDMVGEI